jgi:hypothetical protein
VDVVAKMLRLETAIGDSDGADETVEHVQEAKKLLIGLLLDHDPAQDVSEFKVTGPDVLLLFALIMHGSSVAAAVAEAITQAAPGAAGAGDAVRTPQDADGERPGESGEAPLASVAPSSARSSSSDEPAAGPRATGSG